jgi:energy-coupling factor transport system ATP-binding protein
MLDFTLLESCGVRPPGLNRVLRMLGIEAHAESVDDAYAKIIERYPRASRQLESVAKADTPSIAPPTSNATPIADLRAVSFSYPDGPRILDSIDLRIDAGDFVAIVGPNGSGKTTLAKQIVGLLKPEGTIELDGRDRASMSPAESAHLAAYVFQNPDHQIFAATVEDEVCFGPRNFGLSEGEIRARCDEVLGAVGLEHSREADPFLLSKGERQRLAVASVLALKPRLLILDEPTTGLDHREQLRMMELVSRLNQSGIAIVIITHTPWLVAEYARRVVMMRKGRVIFDGDVRDFFSADDLMRSASFRPPDVALLARRFAAAALTPAELAQSIRELAQGRD